MQYFWEGCGTLNDYGWNQPDVLRHIVWQHERILYRAFCYYDIGYMVSLLKKDVIVFPPERLKELRDAQSSEAVMAWSKLWKDLLDLPQLFIAV